MTAIDAGTTTARAPGARAATARRALRRGWITAAHAVTVARARCRRPLLTTGGFGCIAAAAFQVSAGVGLLATGALVLVFEWLGGDT